MINFFVGVDPGKTGGMAIIDDSDRIWAGYVCPPSNIESSIPAEIRKIWEYAAAGFQPWDVNIYVAVEDVYSWPGESRSSNKKLIENMGIWIGACWGVLWEHCRSMKRPTPREWQKVYTSLPEWDTTITKKKRSFAVCEAVYGLENIRDYVLTPRGGIKDGVTDALLIAGWLKAENPL